MSPKNKMTNENSALDNRRDTKWRRTEIRKVTKVRFLATHDFGGAEGKDVLACNRCHANGDRTGARFHLAKSEIMNLIDWVWGGRFTSRVRLPRKNEQSPRINYPI